MTRPGSARIRTAALVLLGLPLTLAACSSSPAPGSSSSGTATSSVQSADAKVLSEMSAYESRAASCKSASSPVVCVEAADRTLGNQVHQYANLLAVGKGIHASENDLLAARNQAQTLANSFEILGDAQPTQSNYDQVLNTFNLNGAIAQLRAAVHKLDSTLGG